MAAGIRTRHGRSCRSRDGGRCNCSPSYEAWVYSKRDDKKIRRTFKSLAEAKGWRGDAEGAVRKRTVRAPSKVTLAEAAAEWLEGAKAGTIRNHSGDRFKPSTLRNYEDALRLRVLDDLGAVRLEEITKADLQLFADRLLERGLSASTIRVTLASLRVIYSRALDRGHVAVNPTAGLKLPAPRGRRERIADPAEAVALLATLPEHDRALWATALFAGLRLGELRALRWQDVDLGEGVIRVKRSWDPKAGEIEPKSRGGRRTVPISKRLGDPEREGYLYLHRIRANDPDGLVFGNGSRPFAPATVRQRALRAWARAGLEPIGLHEARHTYASMCIAAGVNAKTLSIRMGTRASRSRLTSTGT
ncbi:MAG TPA: site-specific integrase [Solirubrobacterales bacterium]|nr:site-specific integrase [Solirubrobacterales bacterium]